MKTPGQELREHQEAMRRSREARLAGVQGLAGGRVGSAAPNRRSRRGFSDRPQPMPEPLTSGDRVLGSGQLLVMSATGQVFPSGGAYVAPTVIDYRHGFTDMSAPSGSVVWPATAVGTIQVEFGWAAYQNGGKVEIEVDGIVPHWGLVGDGSDGQFGCKRRGAHIERGSIVKVLITQTSGADQAGSVTLEFAIPDPSTLEDLLEISVSPRPHGLTFDSADLWVSSRDGVDSIYRLNPSGGAVLQSVDIAALSGISAANINLYGMAWDGTHLWLASSNGPPGPGTKLWRIDPAGPTIVSSYTPPDHEPRGLTFGDGAVWLHGGINGLIYKINPATGATISSFASPAGPSGSPYEQDGLAHDGTNLWAASRFGNSIYKMNPATGAVLDTFSVPVLGLTDLTVMDGRLLAASFDNGNIVDTGIIS